VREHIRRAGIALGFAIAEIRTAGLFAQERIRILLSFALQRAGDHEEEHMKAFGWLIVAAASLCLAPIAMAQAYPSKPVQIIVGAAAGTAGDVTARVLAEELADKLGPRFVVINKPGANGVIAVEALTSAPKDGYTLFLSASSPLTVTPHLVKDFKWDPVKDFEPVVEIGTTPIAIAVSKKSPITSLQGMIDAAHSKPGAIKVGILALSMSQFAIDMLESEEKVKFLAVPYKGANDIVAALIAGDIDVAAIGLGGITAQLGPGGTLRPLAVTTTERMSALPDTPAVRELVRGYDAGTWFGLFAPRGTDPAVIRTLNQSINDVLKSPRTRSRLEGLGTAPTGGTPAELKQRLASDYARFGSLISQLGLKPQ
jgi:tripartite-type tricarboxylate transporter receptor subunit TctC